MNFIQVGNNSYFCLCKIIDKTGMIITQEDGLLIRKSWCLLIRKSWCQSSMQVFTFSIIYCKDNIKCNCVSNISTSPLNNGAYIIQMHGCR